MEYGARPAGRNRMRSACRITFFMGTVCAFLLVYNQVLCTAIYSCVPRSKVVATVKLTTGAGAAPAAAAAPAQPPPQLSKEAAQAMLELYAPREDPKPPPRWEPREAYVTIMIDDMYNPGYADDPGKYSESLMVWYHSLRAAGSKKDVIVGMTQKMETLFGNQYRALGMEVRLIQHLENPHALEKGSFVKLRVWEFDDYEKLVYVDSDFLVLQNMDRLFEYPDFAATKDFLPTDSYHDFPWDGFNAGMFVFRPSKVTFQHMVTKFAKCPWHFDGKAVRTEQEFMNWYFQDWNRIPNRYALSMYTAVFHKRHPRLVPQFDLNRTVAVHLFCKPWATACDKEKGDKIADYKFLHDLFWEKYDKVFPKGGILKKLAPAR